MPQLTTEMRVLVVKKYLQTESYVEVRETFGRQFPNRNPPYKKRQFKTKSRKYRNESTGVNLNKDKSEMRRRVRTLKTIENVRRF